MSIARASALSIAAVGLRREGGADSSSLWAARSMVVRRPLLAVSEELGGVGGKEELWSMGDGTGGGCGGGTPTDAAAECGDASDGNPTILWAGDATPPPPLGLANEPGRELSKVWAGMPVTLWRVRGLERSCSETFLRWRACASKLSLSLRLSDSEGEEGEDKGAPIDSFLRLVILDWPTETGSAEGRDCCIITICSEDDDTVDELAESRKEEEEGPETIC